MHPPRNRRKLDVLRTFSEQEQSDILGSYTGTPADPEDDMPDQDADDL
ncbi:MAG TPA: hypothetical protein PKE04_06635 [Clostridia bacterium]|nr:hypothetical protein [Clostridia bacterium]